VSPCTEGDREQGRAEQARNFTHQYASLDDREFG
jgi:hypothetical protein